MRKAPPPERVNKHLAQHAGRIKGDRGYEKWRGDMKDAGYDIGTGTLQRLVAGDINVRATSIKKLAAYDGKTVSEITGGELGDESEFVEVPHAAVAFSNGQGRVVYHEDDKPPLSFRADFLRRMSVAVSDAVVVDAHGVSNDPAIREGAVVLINRGDRRSLNGEFYAFRADGELMIKRLTRIDGVGILATAENPNYKPKTKIYRDEGDFEIIGRAVWTGTEL